MKHEMCAKHQIGGSDCYCCRCVSSGVCKWGEPVPTHSVSEYLKLGKERGYLDYYMSLTTEEQTMWLNVGAKKVTLGKNVDGLGEVTDVSPKADKKDKPMDVTHWWCEYHDGIVKEGKIPKLCCCHHPDEDCSPDAAERTNSEQDPQSEANTQTYTKEMDNEVNEQARQKSVMEITKTLAKSMHKNREVEARAIVDAILALKNV